jgi:hypothetical protein
MIVLEIPWNSHVFAFFPSSILIRSAFVEPPGAPVLSPAGHGEEEHAHQHEAAADIFSREVFLRRHGGRKHAV